MKVCARAGVRAALDIALLCGFEALEIVAHEPRHSLVVLLVLEHVGAASEAIVATLPCTVVVRNLNEKRSSLEMRSIWEARVRGSG